MKRSLILICNAHIDPVWLWGWEEGVQETLSTFRTAVNFCEKYDDFIFCNNESLLYEWTEKYDPDLFARITEQVKAGRWHIMGGWYLQPDCNMLLGESLVRQIVTGKKYFIEKFGKEPTTAVNLDSFGHSRGLVQVLAGAGYNSYLFCRPDKRYLDLPGDTFQWLGFDGSVILAHRSDGHYNSYAGTAAKKILKWLNDPENQEKKFGTVLWGIGNHGGGPSESDIREILVLNSEEGTWDLQHGTPEKFFSCAEKMVNELPLYKGDLNPFAIGCYTSMKRVKQAVFSFEHKYFNTEKLLSLSHFYSGSEFPEKRMNEALKELLFCQFHDILPGTSVESVEKDALNRIGFARRIIENEMAAFYINAGNSLKTAVPGEFPVVLLNPQPFDVDNIVALELQLPEPNFDKALIRIPLLFDENGEAIPVQMEKPECNINEDHRKKIVFRARIAAGEIVRYSCFLKDIPAKQSDKEERSDLIFETGNSRLVFDKTSGAPALWSYAGTDLTGPGKFLFTVIEDNADPWGMGIKSFEGEQAGFQLMSSSQVSEFAGLSGEAPGPVYVSEAGEIRTIVESLFAFNNSRIHVKYYFPSGEAGFEVEITVYWMEKDKLLKWLIPVGFNMNCIGRAISGISCFRHRKREFVFRDWLGMKNFEGECSFSIASDGAYGFDIRGNTVGISLLRSPAYSGHPAEGSSGIVRNDRAVKRMDQGVHTFRFSFIPGKTDELIDRSFNDSDLFNNPVISRIDYPTGKGKFKYQGIKISDRTINLQSVKLSDDGDLVIRLLNPCRDIKKFNVAIPVLNAGAEVEINPKQIKTFLINKVSGEFQETDLLERPGSN